MGADNGRSYKTKTNRLRGIHNGDLTAEMQLRNTVNYSSATHDRLRTDHTIPLFTIRKRAGTRSGFKEGTPVFKEYFRERNYTTWRTIHGKDFEYQSYNVGIRFIRDYYNACSRIREGQREGAFQEFGDGNGACPEDDEQFLSGLHARRGQPLSAVDESHFVFRMLGMPIFKWNN